MTEAIAVDGLDPVDMIAQTLGISRLAAAVLAARGYDEITGRSIVGLDRRDYADPFGLSSMDRAAERVLAAAKAGQRVIVAGDYDVDGISGSAIVSEVLKRLEIRHDICLPTREDGYGLSAQAATLAKQRRAALVIAVDCGTNDHAVAKRLAMCGVDLVVLDHHPLTSEQQPAAEITVNPVLPGHALSGSALCGAGVAFKFAQAVFPETAEDRYLTCLAGLGTMGDSVPLTGENRAIAREGLNALRWTGHPGLNSLMNLAGVVKDRVSSRDVAFGIVPRLNAPGRVSSPYDTLKLLMAGTSEEGARLAADLNAVNESRREMVEDCMDECDYIIYEAGLEKQAALLLWGDFPLGVCGIVAARLVEKYGKPSYVASVSPGGLCRGSARSVDGYNVAGALASCAGILATHGGHNAAAGFSAQIRNMPALRTALDRHARNACLPGRGPAGADVVADVAVDAEYLSLMEVLSLDQLEPFGEGWPEPVFEVTGTCRYARTAGADNQHLIVDMGTMEAAYFNGRFGPAKSFFGRRVTALGGLYISRFRGVNKVTMRAARVFHS